MNFDKIIAVRTNKTVYRDGDKCLKMFGEDYSKADVLNEALNQARVEETGLNIPKILEVTKVENKWVIVSEFIEGKTLARLIEENPAKKLEYLERFVGLQLEVQSKSCPQLNKLKDKMNRKISQADLSATVRYDLHTRLEAMPKHTKLCHGDFNQHNLLFAKEGLAVIGFEKLRYDLCVSDLTNFMRKILEKHNWSSGLGMDMVMAYNAVRKLEPWELCQVYLKLLYPEKFWKIVNHYYNSRKTWVSQRDIEKLKRLSEQEMKREEFLSMLFYLVK